MGFEPLLVTPRHFIRFFWKFRHRYKYIEVKRGTARVKCLAQEHETTTWRTSRPRVQCVWHLHTCPNEAIVYVKRQKHTTLGICFWWDNWFVHEVYYFLIMFASCILHCMHMRFFHYLSRVKRRIWNVKLINLIFIPLWCILDFSR